MTSIQEQIDQQVEGEQEATTTEVAEKPLLTDAAIRADKRRTDLVEINFSDQTARIVDTSDAPKLTLADVKAKADPIQDADLIFDTKTWTVKVRMGIPFAVRARQAQLLSNMKGTAPEQIKNRNRAVNTLFVAKMMDSPKFSYGGEGEGTPVEECSDILIEALLTAISEKNTPLEDDIYQVTVLRSQPIHTAILLQNTFDAYPIGTGKKTQDMTDREIEATAARSLEQRRVFVSSMVFPEAFTFSLNGEGSDGDTYPIEDISEQFLQTLHTAYRVSNIPEAGLDAAQRFRSMGGDANGQESGT